MGGQNEVAAIVVFSKLAGLQVLGVEVFGVDDGAGNMAKNAEFVGRQANVIAVGRKAVADDGSFVVVLMTVRRQMGAADERGLEGCDQAVAS